MGRLSEGTRGETWRWPQITPKGDLVCPHASLSVALLPTSQSFNGSLWLGRVQIFLKQFRYFICLQLSLSTLYNKIVHRIMLTFLVRFKSKTFINKQFSNVNIWDISPSQLIRTVSEYYLSLESISIHLHYTQNFSKWAII